MRLGNKKLGKNEAEALDLVFLVAVAEKMTSGLLEMEAVSNLRIR